jgi:putative protease
MSAPTRRPPEILAPAGDEASLLAALAAGADAVYFGLDEGLNARARAKNFPLATLGATCDRVHRAGARAYLTLNTVVFEEELAFLEGVIRAAASAGVDALIVQDPAVALLARAIAPTLEVHASTQMTVSSPEAARFAEALGCTRLVAPRELSVKEIARFAAGTRLELEVFVHGALCMSWSGQCLTSEAWGGRSANRGQCAQSCRLPYTLVVDGAPRDTGDVRYLLSPLDQAAFRALPALVEVGVASLKIEGRMKGPAYVATAVSGYRRWLDAILSGAAGRKDAQAAAQADLARMGLTYSRGFSDGFFAGSDHQDLVEGRFPKHRGLLLGDVAEVGPRGVRVTRGARHPSGGTTLGAYAPEGVVSAPLPPVAGASAADARGLPLPTPEIVPGMGVGFDTGHPEAEEPGATVWTVTPTEDGWWLGFDRSNASLARVRVGHRVWITADPRIDREVERLVGDGEPEGRIPVRVAVAGRAGEPIRVRFSAGEGRAEVHADGESDALLTPSSGAGLGADTLADKLGAFGGTPFRLAAIDTRALESGLHLPVSALKGLRRALAPQLLDRALAASRHVVDPSPAVPRVVAAARREWTPRPESTRPALVPLCRTDAQLDAVIAAGLPEVELDWMELVGLGRAVERARAAGLRVGIATVRVHKPGEDAFDRRIASLRPDAVLARHWAGLVHFSGLEENRPVVHGDFSLNVTNSVTAHQLLAMGVDTVTAAHDLDEVQLHALLGGFPADRMTVVLHHHISMFHTEHCVYAHTLSHGRDYRTCGRPCESRRVALRDPVGLDHPVVVDVGCRNTVFEARAQTAARSVPRLLAAGVRRFRIEFVWEDAAQVATVLDAYAGLLAGRVLPEEVVRRVAAHERFGVTSGTMRTMTEATR